MGVVYWKIVVYDHPAMSFKLATQAVLDSRTAQPGKRSLSRPVRLALALLMLLSTTFISTVTTIAEANHSTFTKTEPPKPKSHSTRNIEGWNVRLDDRLLEPVNAALLAPALKFLESRLFDIKMLVNPDILKKLQNVTIVLDLTHGKLRPMQYHPDAGWLRENGYSTNLVKCVHIPVATDLITARNINQQPMVMLHELAHAYHDQVLGFEEPRILKAFEDYKKSGRGERALLYDGSLTRHYGLSDQKEFFAEMTEAYFGMNDFYPFNRAELVTAEPAIFELMQTIWGPVAGVPSKNVQAKSNK